MPLRQAEETIRKLHLLGLTDGEARVYWAVAKLGTGKASEIQRDTELHRPEIYRIIPSLIKKQLVEETLDRPKRYRCQKVEEAIKRLGIESLNRYQNIAQATDDVVRVIKRLQALEPPDKEPQIRIFSGIENIRKDFSETLTSTKNEILLLVPKASVKAATRNQIAQLIKTVSSKKLKARVILELDEDTVNVARRLGRTLDVRHYTPIPVYLWIADNQHVTIGLNPTTLNKQESSALLTSYPAYVKIMREFFEATWRLSTPLTAKIQTLNQSPTPATRVIWGREDMAKSTDDWPMRAKRRILEIATRHGPNRILERYGKAYAEASQRGVKVQILCTMNGDNRKAVKKLSETCGVRHVSSPFGLGIAILDDSEALIHYINPDTSTLATSNTDIAVYTSDRQLVQDLSHMFDFIWKHATPIHRSKTMTTHASRIHQRG